MLANRFRQTLQPLTRRPVSSQFQAQRGIFGFGGKKDTSSAKAKKEMHDQDKPKFAVGRMPLGPGEHVGSVKEFKFNKIPHTVKDIATDSKHLKSGKFPDTAHGMHDRHYSIAKPINPLVGGYTEAASVMKIRGAGQALFEDMGLGTALMLAGGGWIVFYNKTQLAPQNPDMKTYFDWGSYK